MRDNDKPSDDVAKRTTDKVAATSSSSAANVERHLLGLEKNNDNEQDSSQIEDQDFDEEQLANVINLKRFQDLLRQSDEFLGHLSGEIDNFGD